MGGRYNKLGESKPPQTQAVALPTLSTEAPPQSSLSLSPEDSRVSAQASQLLGVAWAGWRFRPQWGLRATLDPAGEGGQGRGGAGGGIGTGPQVGAGQG